MYWLMVVKDHRAGRGQITPAMQVLTTRVRRGFWLVSPKNPYARRIQPSDRGLFYLSSREGRVLAGECTIISALSPITNEIKNLIEGYPSSLLTHYLGIKCTLWANPIPAHQVVPQMSFVKNKARWAAYLQGTLHPITEEDYLLVKQMVEAEAGFRS
jgi:hypothetical protein